VPDVGLERERIGGIEVRLYTEGIGSRFRVKKITVCRDCLYYTAVKIAGIVLEECTNSELPEALKGRRRSLRARDSASISKPAPVYPPIWCPLAEVSE